MAHALGGPHPTHNVMAKGALMFCGSCGYWSVERLGVGLARPCCKVPSAYHAIALRYLHKGTVPYRGHVVATAAGHGVDQGQQLCVVGLDTESEDEGGHLADSEGGDDDDERWLEAGADLQIAPDGTGAMAPGCAVGTPPQREGTFHLSKQAPTLAPRVISDGGPGNPPVDAVTPPLPMPLPFHSTQAPSTVGHLAGPEGGEDEEDERWLEAGAELQLADDAGTMAPGWTSAMQR